MPNVNPKWQKAETERLLAEDAYSNFMNSQEAIDLRTAYNKRVESLNATIEAANQKIRDIPQYIE